jgi:hypothetical protein
LRAASARGAVILAGRSTSSLGVMNSDVIELEEQSTTCVGKVLTVGPVYGWGWSGIQPPSFQLRLDELHRDTNRSVRGGIGQIVSPDHPLSGHWVVFTLRYRGSWNFERNRAHYNVCIYAARPNDDIHFASGGRFADVPKGAVTCGYAIIGLPLTARERWIQVKGWLPLDLFFSLLVVPMIVLRALLRPSELAAMPSDGRLQWLSLMVPRFVLAVLFWGALFVALQSAFQWWLT